MIWKLNSMHQSYLLNCVIQDDLLGRWSSIWLFWQQCMNHLGKILWKDRRNPFKLCFQNFLAQFLLVHSYKRLCQRDYLKQDNSKWPDIRLFIIRLVLPDLWGEVIRSPHSFINLLFLINVNRCPQIAYFQWISLSQKYVQRFEISMNNPLRVQHIQPKQDLKKVLPNPLLTD